MNKLKLHCAICEMQGKEYEVTSMEAYSYHLHRHLPPGWIERETIPFTLGMLGMGIIVGRLGRN
tara:strand:- start:701 stop:892 length:192 start_codon:yes stop_codon:yes gene_type:complete